VPFYKDNYNNDLYSINVELGFDANRLKHYQEAIDDENQAIAVNPESPAAFFVRGRTYFLLNERANAESDFKNCLDRYILFVTDDAKALAYFYLGDTAKASKIMNRIVKRTNIPREDLAGNYYSMACFKSLMNKPTEAVLYLKKAIDEGYSTVAAIYDQDFDTIRNIPQFKEFYKQ
jgi:tetratricopeptide (TPR) repeat protein